MFDEAVLFRNPLFLTFVVLAAAAVLINVRLRRRFFQVLGLARHSESCPSEKEQQVLYANDFPPSRREALCSLKDTLPDTIRRIDSDKLGQVPYVSAGNCVPIDIPSDDVPGNMCTPTGFSMAEVRALGDFPDYATLSGVPDPEPYHDFDYERAVPRPYRPFRCPYHQTMSISRLDTDWWLELESNYQSRLEERRNLYRANPDSIMRYAPGSELACKELMEVALSWLTKRYPRYFSLSDDKAHFHNRILNSTTQLRPPEAHPLHILFQNVPEDFVLMQRDGRTGHYRLRAGFIVSSVGWTLGEKFDKPLHEIHAPVPHYAAKMGASMTRFFARMPTDRPIQRGSWDICPGRMLFAAPDDPQLVARAAGPAVPACPLDDLHLRVDWQTLRRLPLSGAICFNFKARFTPLPAFQAEPYVPAVLSKILRDGDQKMLAYKMIERVAAVPAHNGDKETRSEPLADVLDRWTSEQQKAGVMEKDWEPGTLAEHPFFPGWEERWHQEQGF